MLTGGKWVGNFKIFATIEVTLTHKKKILIEFARS